MDARRIAIGVAGAIAVAGSLMLGWATVTFGGADVMPTTVRGTELWPAWAGAAAAGVAIVALAFTAAAGSEAVRRTARAGALVAGLAALLVVAAAAIRTAPIIDAGTEAAAGRISAATGLPAERLATLLAERAGDETTVTLGAGPLLAAAGALVLVGTAAGLPRRRSAAPNGVTAVAAAGS